MLHGTNYLLDQSDQGRDYNAAKILNSNLT